jgi:hypothetical protein
MTSASTLTGGAGGVDDGGVVEALVDVHSLLVDLADFEEDEFAHIDGEIRW